MLGRQRGQPAVPPPGWAAAWPFSPRTPAACWPAAVTCLPALPSGCRHLPCAYLAPQFPPPQYYAELGMPAQARLLAEQAEAAGGGGAGVLGSLRGAVGGTVGSLVSRMQGERG